MIHWDWIDIGDSPDNTNVVWLRWIKDKQPFPDDPNEAIKTAARIILAEWILNEDLEKVFAVIKVNDCHYMLIFLDKQIPTALRKTFNQTSLASCITSAFSKASQRIHNLSDNTHHAPKEAKAIDFNNSYHEFIHGMMSQGQSSQGKIINNSKRKANNENLDGELKAKVMKGLNQNVQLMKSLSRYPHGFYGSHLNKKQNVPVKEVLPKRSTIKENFSQYEDYQLQQLMARTSVGDSAVHKCIIQEAMRRAMNAGDKKWIVENVIGHCPNYSTKEKIQAEWNKENPKNTISGSFRF